VQRYTQPRVSPYASDPRPFVALLLALLAAACTRPDVSSEDCGRLALEGATRLVVRVPSERAQRALAPLADELERSQHWRVEWVVDSAFGGEPDPHAAQLWFADALTPGIGALAQRHGVVFEHSGAFWFAGERFAAPGDGVQLTLPDPARPGWPLEVVLAPSAEDAVALARSLAPSWRPGALLWRGGLISKALRGMPGGSLASVSGGPVFDLVRSAPVRVQRDGVLEHHLHGDVPAAAFEHYAKLAKRCAQDVEKWLGPQPPDAAPLRVHVWPRLDQLASATGVWDLSAPGARAGEVHVLVASAALHDGGAQIARELAVRAAGPPPESWALAALGVEASQGWFGAPLEVALQLACAAADSAEAWRAPPAHASVHVFQPLRALALRTALRGLDLQARREAWSAGRLAEHVDPQRFAERFEKLAGLGRTLLETRRAARDTLGVRDGVHLVQARDDYGWRAQGYGSSACDDALKDLASLGADAVVFQPTYFERTPPREWWGARLGGPFSSDASDAALWAAFRSARALGLRVVLAPELLSTPTGAATVRRVGEDEAARAERIAMWRALVEHTALLAELTGVDVLILGERASKISFEWGRAWDEPEAERAPGAPGPFAAIFASARRSFSGAVSYTLFLDGEQKNFAHADDCEPLLVRAKLSLSVPQRPGEAPTDVELRNLFEVQLGRAKDVAGDAARPLWWMGVGFPPTSEGWRDSEFARGSYDAPEQARLAAAFAVALQRARAAGRAPDAVFFGHWSTDPEHGNGVDRSYTLQNRSAAESLPALLERP
jgi:hypothetical protein